MEAGRKLPSKEVILQTQDADYHLFKTDILAGLVTYSTDKNVAANLETITAERAKQIIEMNRNGEKPLSLQDDGKQKETKKSVDLLANENINRFDKAKKKRRQGNKNGQKAQAANDKQPQQAQPNKKQEGRKEQPQRPQKAARQQQKPQSQQPKGDRQQPKGDNQQERPAQQQRQPRERENQHRNNSRRQGNRPPRGGQQQNDKQQDAKE